MDCTIEVPTTVEVPTSYHKRLRKRGHAGAETTSTEETQTEKAHLQLANAR